YHQMKTYYLLKSFICFASDSRKANQSSKELWYKTVEEHLLVTHGSDHPWYAMLQKYLIHSGSQKVVINCHKRDPKSDEMPVISSKPYIAGDVVFKCKPLMTIDWSFHKNECQLMRQKKLRSDPNWHMYNRLLRLYLRIKSEPTFLTESHQLIDGSNVCLNTISVDKNPIVVNAFNVVKKQFKILGIDFKESLLKRYYRFILGNSFQMRHYSDDPMDNTNPIGLHIGNAVTLELMCVRHSCHPNTAFITKGDSIEIRAMKSIASGEEITMDLIPLDKTGFCRDFIRDYLHIKCDCVKCKPNVEKRNEWQEFEQLLKKHDDHWEWAMNSNLKHKNLNYEMDTQFIQYLDSIYGKYHQMKTYYLLKSFICFASDSRKANQSSKELWYKTVEEHLLVTHGSDHPCCKVLLSPTFEDYIIGNRPPKRRLKKYLLFLVSVLTCVRYGISGAVRHKSVQAFFSDANALMAFIPSLICGSLNKCAHNCLPVVHKFVATNMCLFRNKFKILLFIESLSEREIGYGISSAVRHKSVQAFFSDANALMGNQPIVSIIHVLVNILHLIPYGILFAQRDGLSDH
ncbi:unnamed protein product, partial [Medioppia subpectinata]